MALYKCVYYYYYYWLVTKRKTSLCQPFILECSITESKRLNKENAINDSKGRELIKDAE